MTTIFYGVCGEGNGHATRAKIIIDELKKNHRVSIFSYGKGYASLKRHFPVRRIHGFRLYYINNTLSSFLTAVLNILKFPLMVLFSFRYISAFLFEKPAVVITDFEPFILYWAKIFCVPCVSIDNQHSITNTQIDEINGTLVGMHARTVLCSFFPYPTETMITTFFYPLVIKKRTTLVPPLIRPAILNATPVRGKHILVYQTSPSYKKLPSVLKKLPQEFIVYGYGEGAKERKEKNLLFRKFNEEQYIVDLRTADAVIINGGFMVLSEALYLQKPIFAVPIKRQFEQIVNGHYLNKLGYGRAVKEIMVENFTQFLEKKEQYRKNIKRINWDKNKKFFIVLEEKIKTLTENI